MRTRWFIPLSVYFHFSMGTVHTLPRIVCVSVGVCHLLIINIFRIIIMRNIIIWNEGSESTILINCKLHTTCASPLCCAIQNTKDWNQIIFSGLRNFKIGGGMSESSLSVLLLDNKCIASSVYLFCLFTYFSRLLLHFIFFTFLKKFWFIISPLFELLS